MSLSSQVFWPDKRINIFQMIANKSLSFLSVNHIAKYKQQLTAPDIWQSSITASTVDWKSNKVTASVF